jgi:hypothetical protein
MDSTNKEKAYVLFSEKFNLSKTQAELDFVNVPINGDFPLFIDPFAISQRNDPFSRKCHTTIVDYFMRIIKAIRSNKKKTARLLLGYLREPNETRLGYSRGKPRGAGIGKDQSEQIFQALLQSTAVKTGFLSSLEECELLIEGISRDKISDLTTNVIREHLAAYTKQQCNLWNITTQKLPLPPSYSSTTHQWFSKYFDLPVACGKPVLLIPKVIARYDPSYEHQRYYRHFVLDYLQTEHLSAGSSLVRTLKNGRKVVYKKDIEATFPCTKENLFEFSRKHPEVLLEYREKLKEIEKRGIGVFVEPKDEIIIAKALCKALKSIPSGNRSASDFHNIIIGILEFLFFPSLLHPLKEKEIHEGRKRIDILMENGAQSGIFHLLHDVRKLPCAFVPIECKNYGKEVANPELDQLAGRFSVNRGKFGILCCRKFRNRKLFIKRCQDTLKDDRGLIIPLDDKTIIQMLGFISAQNREKIDSKIGSLINEVWVS